MRKPSVINGKVPNRLILLMGHMALSGCSIYQAVNAPPPIDYKRVTIGTTRTETISRLGFPKMTDQKNHRKVDSFEFQDGYNPASKARIVLYLAGDVFTAGLSELIFWPLEANVFDGKQCRGTVTYNADDKVIGYEMMDKEGQHLWYSPIVPD